MRTEDEIENSICAQKIALLDSCFYSEANLYSKDYLYDINKYLFIELYPQTRMGSRYDFFEDEEYIAGRLELDQLINNLESIFANTPSFDELITLVAETAYQIFNYQMFVVGNTRTILIYLSQIFTANGIPFIIIFMKIWIINHESLA